MDEPELTPVPAADLNVGDVFLLEGKAVTVTGIRFGKYWVGPDFADGVAIDWENGNRLGRMSRRETDTLDRVKAG